MDVVSVREFARRIGVSLTAVQKGVKTGRIEAITDQATGKVTGIDYDTQAAAWKDNAKAPGRKPHNVGGGRPRNDGQPPAPPQTNGGGPHERSEKTPTPAGQMSMAEVQRARELVKLQIDNLKLKEAQAELVNAAEVKQQGFKLAATIINGLYNIPDRVSDEIAGMSNPHEIAKLLIREIDQVVEDLRGSYAAT